MDLAEHSHPLGLPCIAKTATFVMVGHVVCFTETHEVPSQGAQLSRCVRRHFTLTLRRLLGPESDRITTSEPAMPGD